VKLGAAGERRQTEPVGVWVKARETASCIEEAGKICGCTPPGCTDSSWAIRGPVAGKRMRVVRPESIILWASSL